MKMRLDKYLAHFGLGTRKELKSFIRKGLVKVNDIIIKKDDYKVDPDCDFICFNDQKIEYRQYVYIMLNKPAGCVCATQDQVHRTVIDLIEGYDHYDLFPVGRLDKDTEGLLIITNNGDFAHKLMAPKRKHAKLYYAVIDGIVTEDDIRKFKEGIYIGDYQCQPAQLTVLAIEENYSEVYIEIYEGKFHQIKRMVQATGKKVVYLKRLQIKTLKLDPHLESGRYRELTDDELFDLMKDL